MNLNGYTILVVEDDIMNYKYLEALLSRKTAASLIWAINGEQAVEYCKLYENIDLVIMDIQLPLLNGLEASKAIKSMRPALPIIIQSANSYNDERKTSLDIGCDAYFTKPICSDKLLQQISASLNAPAVSRY